MRKIIVLFLLGVIFLPSCRKGEGDPFLSLRSRKNRLTGKWEVVGGYLEQTELTGSFTNLHFKVSLFKTSAHVDASISNAWEYGMGSDDMRYSEKFEFNGDGTFTHFMQFDTDTWDEEGEWNFTHGVGKDRKNKSEILLMFRESTTSFYGRETWDGEIYSVVYDLQELRNNRITIHMQYKYTDHTDGDYVYYTEHKILEKDK